MFAYIVLLLIYYTNKGDSIHLFETVSDLGANPVPNTVPYYVSVRPGRCIVNVVSNYYVAYLIFWLNARRDNLGNGAALNVEMENRPVSALLYLKNLLVIDRRIQIYMRCSQESQ